MTRAGRKKSEGDVYHVIVRGVGQQILFEDDADRSFFMKALDAAFEKHGLELFAWCLMSNHVHLLVHGPIEIVGKAMRECESGYALYFNRRHERTGVLFQGRYDSVPIEGDQQLLSALRYVHMNPVKAGEPIDGRWSSYAEYFPGGRDGYAKTDFVLSILDGVEAFKELHDAPGDYQPLGPRHHLTESEALKRAQETLGDIGFHEVKSFDRETRNALLLRLYEAGLSRRQIMRITGIGLGIVNRATRC